jgi:hypothetical protein
MVWGGPRRFELSPDPVLFQHVGQDKCDCDREVLTKR